MSTTTKQDANAYFSRKDGNQYDSQTVGVVHAQMSQLPLIPPTTHDSTPYAELLKTPHATPHLTLLRNTPPHQSTTHHTMLTPCPRHTTAHDNAHYHTPPPSKHQHLCVRILSRNGLPELFGRTPGLGIPSFYMRKHAARKNM